MKDATLCLLIKKSPAKEILLAMKKRGFGIGKWNGVGGKIDKEKGDKSIVDAVARETKEEIGVELINPEKVALLRFRFPYNKDWNQDVHVFLINKWKGEPKESEEMLPKWFKTKEIPYHEMWDDDKFWLPYVLAGKKLEADFVFKTGEIVSQHNLNFVSEI